MASNQRKRVRYTFDIHFTSPEEKEAFHRRLKSVRERLTPSGCPSIDNHTLMNAFLDAVEAETAVTADKDSTAVTQSFMRNGGVYTDSSVTEEELLFVTERYCLADLMKGLASPCDCGMTRSPWIVESVVQKGHVLRILFCCHQCRHYKRTWSSSRVFGGHYLANQKMIHSFTCSGILPSQYIHLSQFAGLGTVGHAYIRQVYNRCGYIDVVHKEAEKSMMDAVENVKSLPNYAVDGEWVITDARHDSTANAFHTTVPCLSGSTQRIIGISTLSRNDHSTAQTRELECTKVVIPQVIARGINITEVAHDIQMQVSRYVSKELQLVNSYDTWHGTKNVAKELKKITKGPKKKRDVVWFPQLVDKQRSIKTHLYWCMKNCQSSSQLLRDMTLNIPNHYQGDHSACHSSSPCQTLAYSPSKVLLTDQLAVEQLTRTLERTYIFRNAEDFSRCRDTFWVESFNHQMLSYVPKRIHFSTKTFLMRMNLAVMDWNENVNRPYTSERHVKDLRRPDRRTAMKVLVAKSFDFIELLWTAYVDHNKTDLRAISDDEETDDETVFEEGEIVPECSDESDLDDDDD